MAFAADDPARRGRRGAVRPAQNQQIRTHGAARRGDAARPRSRGPAVPLARRLHFGAPPADHGHGRRQGDLGRQGSGLPRPQPHGQPVSGRHDLLFPPFGRRLPRRQAGPLSGPDRPLPELPQRRGARHAQHPLPDRPRRRRTAAGRAPRDGKRSGVVRRWDRRSRHPAAGNRPLGQRRSENDGRRRPRRQGVRRGVAGGRTGGYDARARHRAHGVPSQLPEIRIHGPPKSRSPYSRRYSTTTAGRPTSTARRCPASGPTTSCAP